MGAGRSRRCRGKDVRYKSIAESHMSANLIVPNEFQRFAIDLATSLVSFDEAVFYVLSPDVRRCESEVRNMNHATVSDYRREFEVLDPLNAAKFSSTDIGVATLQTQMPFSKLRRTRYYQDFLLSREYHDSAVLYFRIRQKIVALIGVLRTHRMPAFNPAEFETLEKLSPFISYSLERECRNQLSSQEQDAIDKHLTVRERQIASLLTQGLTNKRIALRLGIQPSTVKTHVLNIFEKAGVANRCEFTSRYVQR